MSEPCDFQQSLRDRDIRLDCAMAATVCDRYAADTVALDVAFFDGTPMMDALRAAPESAVKDAQSVRVHDHRASRLTREPIATNV